MVGFWTTGDHHTFVLDSGTVHFTTGDGGATLLRVAFVAGFVAVGAVGVDVHDRRGRASRPTEDEVRQTLLRHIVQEHGPGTLWEEDLRTQPLVEYPARNGSATVWAIGWWRIYPDSLRFGYAPRDYHLLHLKRGGYFKRSWSGEWEAITETRSSLDCRIPPRGQE
jgi:hypothetical protein